MPTVSRVTETLFNHVRAELEHFDPITIAMSNRLSMKTILMIKGSETFTDYEKQKEAQHPRSVKPPLGKRFDIIEQKIDELLGYVKQNRLL